MGSPATLSSHAARSCPGTRSSPFRAHGGLGAVEAGIRDAELDSESGDPLTFFDGNLARIPGGGRTGENGAQAFMLGVNWSFHEWTRLMVNGTNYLHGRESAQR